MPPRTRPTSRPSTILPGNPAAAAPEDDDESTATGTAGYGDVVDDVAAEAGPGAAETPEEAPAAAAGGNGGAATRKPRAARGGAKGAATKPAKPATPKPAAEATPESAAEGGARAGRPRVPRPGPVTRVTVDLAVTEQQALDKMTGTIGRQIERATGKRKIYVQSLMRVAARRLISDADFRAAVTADLAENRDELKREK